MMINLLNSEAEKAFETLKKEGIEIGKKIQEDNYKKINLVNSFFFFLGLGNLDNYIFESKYSSGEVMSILSQKLKPEMLCNFEVISNFNETLRKKGVIIG